MKIKSIKTTKLRLLIDECLPAAIAEEIKTCPGILHSECIDATHSLGNQGTPDNAIIQYAKDKRLILVTVESRLNERRYKICTHAGIIILREAGHHESERVDLFRRFMRSGERAKSRHAVTKLRKEGSVRVEQTEEGSVVEVSIVIPK